MGVSFAEDSEADRANSGVEKASDTRRTNKWAISKVKLQDLIVSRCVRQ